MLKNCITLNNTFRRSVIANYRLSVRSFHVSALSNKDDKEIKPLSEDKDEDTLKHLYKKKYEFIQKQNLEESYNQLKDLNELEKSNYQISENSSPSTSSSQTSSNDKTFQRTQRIKLLASGLVALILTLGGLEVYSNWASIKSKYFAHDNLESFDEMYERIKEKKQKKQQALEIFSNNISNPNDSSIPGVYICGNNQNHLVAESESFEYIPVFKRLDFFDNFIVKDLFLSSQSGALINDKGDLYQWGDGFKGDSTKPTIKGKKLIKVQISNNVIYALTSNGEVIYLPENYDLQKEISQKEKGWLGSYNVNYFKLDTPKKNIIDISSGLEHLTLLDKQGSVYTTATGYNTKISKSYGQFGLPEFSQFDEPPKTNEVHDVVLVNKYMKSGKILNRKITQIATGDYFTLCLDKSGIVWAFGKNTHGAIGTTVNYDSEIIPYPTEVQFISTHFKRNEFPQCIDIEAGGDTAYATFKSSNIYELFEKSLKSGDELDDRFTFDSLPDAEQNNLYLSWGHGLKGELGLGHFIHGSYEPKKIKVLNEIKEFNEMTNKLEKIGVKYWAAGKNHVFVTLENNDVYVWGDNEYGQLGNGKRIRSGAPSTIPSLLEPDADNRVKYSRFNNRLQLLDNGKIHQEIVAGRDTSAIIYKKNH